MMKTLRWIAAGLLLASAQHTYAQSYIADAAYTADALRFSQTNYGSTARFKAMGNAQIGIGGDLSSLGGNPAGLALFSKSEIAITPEFNKIAMNANFLGANINTNKNQLNLNQFAAAFYAPIYKSSGKNLEKGVISAVFGLGFNRNNNYVSELNYAGNNNNNSITDFFAQEATLKGITGIQKIAFDNHLITYNANNKTYFSETYANNNNAAKQAMNNIRRGSVSEYIFAGSLNVSNQIYIGVSIGLVNLNYITDAQFTETGYANEYDADGNATGKKIPYNLIYSQNQKTKGSGINCRTGIIYRPIPSLRLGINIQTPTWFTIDDSYVETLDNRTTIRGTAGSDSYPFAYKLATPLKGSFGVSYVIGKSALITGDIDFTDYGSIRFSDNDNAVSQTIMDNNTAVRSNFTDAVNYRFGAEVKLIESFSLRGGYGVNGNPFKNNGNKFFENKIYSGGIGYRNKDYYFDIAYQRMKNNTTYSPYILNGKEPIAKSKNLAGNVFLTFGLRF